MAAHRYWRLYVNAAAAYVGISEIELRNAVGGSDLTGSGTASHSIALSGWESDKAFDNNTGTAWATYPNSPPQWIAYDFGSGVTYDIVEIRITPRTDGFYTEAPTNFNVQYSDDGSAWTTGWSVSGAVWTSAAPQTFGAPIAGRKVTQVAVEVIAFPSRNARVTQDAVEVIVAAGPPPPAEELRETQAVLEVVEQSPPAAGVRETQAALEHVDYPVNELWATQVCLEVLFPASGFAVLKRNHSFIGSWQGTGHEPNASFNN